LKSARARHDLGIHTPFEYQPLGGRFNVRRIHQLDYKQPPQARLVNNSLTSCKSSVKAISELSSE
jgi:hypothetical protein